MSDSIPGESKGSQGRYLSSLSHLWERLEASPSAQRLRLFLNGASAQSFFLTIGRLSLY